MWPSNLHQLKVFLYTWCSPTDTLQGPRDPRDNPPGCWRAHQEARADLVHSLHAPHMSWKTYILPSGRLGPPLGLALPAPRSLLGRALDSPQSSTHTKGRYPQALTEVCVSNAIGCIWRQVAVVIDSARLSHHFWICSAPTRVWEAE